MFLLDPDSAHGSTYVQNYMDGKGIKTWQVITWRDYHHHWVQTDMPTNVQWNGKLIDGMGDWRGKHGYGLAAPSVINLDGMCGIYKLPEDNPHKVPYVYWEDLLPLLRLSRTHTSYTATALELPIPVLQRVLPQWAYNAAKEISEMSNTGSVVIGSRKWESRSEAVLSILMSSLLNGYNYRAVQKWCGDYRDDNWWMYSTSKAVQYIVNEGTRPNLLDLYKRSFPELTTKDEDVFRAMLAILWYVGDTSGHISNRDIQLLVARGRYSVSASVSRLIKDKYVTLLEPSDGTKASKYKVNMLVPTEERTVSLSDRIHQDAKRHGGLSQNQIAILDHLSAPETPADIADELGISLSSVYYALNKLKKYGFVNKDGKEWSKERITIDRVNATLDVNDSFQKRKSRIATERRMFSNRG